MSVPPRTTNSLVQGVLGGNYGRVNGVLSPLDPYVVTASAIVDQLILLAGQNNRQVPSDGSVGSQAELIERWLAAAYYCKLDPLFTQKGQGGASASFERGERDASGSQYKEYEKAAVDMDPSGCLTAILKRKVASCTWLGKPPSQQIPIWQRD